MKKNIKSLISLLALLVTSSAFGQVSFNYLGERWTESSQGDCPSVSTAILSEFDSAWFAQSLAVSCFFCIFR